MWLILSALEVLDGRDWQTTSIVLLRKLHGITLNGASLPQRIFYPYRRYSNVFFPVINTNTHSELFQLVFFFRWEESITTFSHHSSINKCAILEMVEYLPECLKVSLYLASNVT